jgi:hypothetical protein
VSNPKAEQLARAMVDTLAEHDGELDKALLPYAAALVQAREAIEWLTMNCHDVGKDGNPPTIHEYHEAIDSAVAAGAAIDALLPREDEEKCPHTKSGPGNYPDCCWPDEEKP